VAEEVQHRYREATGVDPRSKLLVELQLHWLQRQGALLRDNTNRRLRRVHLMMQSDDPLHQLRAVLEVVAHPGAHGYRPLHPIKRLDGI